MRNYSPFSSFKRVFEHVRRFIFAKTKMKSMFFYTIVLVHVFMVSTIDMDQSMISKGCNKNKLCCEKATIVCCDGYILQVQNETTASCVPCLAAGQSCYQTNRPCCPGYRCGSGPVVYSEPRATDICISNLIRG